TVAASGTHFIGGETAVTHQVTVAKRTGDCGLAETGIDAGPFLAAGILLALTGGGLLLYRKVKSAPAGKHVA
ncbi:MAG TPA: LPXTG cell wall anchor domain-containing protein, partial [Candidatus Saccharibacteria bacterium]|nr:LPXTG cell wall anchor domain-containing protein [Candidatus Saccharibacteria bacterium]